MRRWLWVGILPLAFLLNVCVTERGASQDGGASPAEPGEPAGAAEPGDGDEADPDDGDPETFAPPWDGKTIADTIEDLSFHDWAVRREAIRRIVGAGPWIVPFLQVALKNPDPDNRQEVAYCLGRIGDPAAVPSLVEILKGDPPYGVIVYVAEALGRIGDPAAAEAVRPYLEYTLERQVYGREVGPVELKIIVSREATVRHAAAEALALLGDTRGVPAIIAGLTGNGWVRRDAAVRLRRLTGGTVDFGFHLDVKDTEKKRIQKAWLDWWADHRDGFEPCRTFPREALDVYMPREDDGKEPGGEKDEDDEDE
jgi:hypothetical protein